MRLSKTLIVAAMTVGAALSLAVALAASKRIESATLSRITTLLVAGDLTWATVTADGLQVSLSGTAPSEAARFRALSLAGEVVAAHRVTDAMSVAAAADIAAPEFLVELLRDGGRVSLLGLIPAENGRAGIIGAIAALPGGARVTDLLETADHPAPPGWDVALDYAVAALSHLPQSKISVRTGVVTITAITDSTEARARLEQTLRADAPRGVDLTLDLSAPRPVIAPFTLHYLVEAGTGRFDACSADSEATRTRILRAAGLGVDGACRIGLGRPSPHWAEAVERAIAALAGIGDGSVTFADTDITFAAAETTPRALFDRAANELEAALPEGFALHVVPPEPEQAGGPGPDDSAAPEFIATLSPEGLAHLHGHLADGPARAAESYMRSHAGVRLVHSTTRPHTRLPPGWTAQALAGLAALGALGNGQVILRADLIELRGTSGNPDAQAEITRMLSERPGAAQNVLVEVRHAKWLSPDAALPAPEDCVANINAILEGSKIAFAPSSADISPSARRTLNALADKVRECRHVKMEIGGHTDSQGREQMNLGLSQARADAVLNALIARRVLTSNLTAKGYGESRPIADNDTEAGRRQNRRITFTLIAGAGGDAADITAGGRR